MTHSGLTLEELSARTGASVHALREWCSLGLLGAKCEESFGPEDVERARIIDLCVRRPMIAAAAMSLSSVSVIGNALRLRGISHCDRRAPFRRGRRDDPAAANAGKIG